MIIDTRTLKNALYCVKMRDGLSDGLCQQLEDYLCSLAQCMDRYTNISAPTLKRLVSEIVCHDLTGDEKCIPIVEHDINTDFCIPISAQHVANLDTEIRANMDRIYLKYCNSNTEYGRHIMAVNLVCVLTYYAELKLIGTNYTVMCDSHSNTDETKLITAIAHYTLPHTTKAVNYRPDFEFKDVAAFDNVCIDIETFGTKPNTIIHEIALTFFNDDELGLTYCWQIDWQKQDRKFGADTIHWWLTRPRVMRERVTNTDNRIDLEDALKKICKMANKKQKVWGNSPRFDCGFLENAFDQYGLELPWDFRKERDFRTLLDISPVERGLFVNDAPHTAAGDSKYQAQLIMKSLQQIKGKLNV